MTSIFRPKRSHSSDISSYSAKKLCFIVGLTCIVGFTVDMVALGAPPNPGALEWRINFLQQMGDRSILFLFGSALLLYSLIEQRRLVRRLAPALLAIGIFFQLSCILVIRDSIVLQRQTLSNIDTRAQELQTQIQENRNSPDLPPEITPEQFQQVSQQVAAQAESLRQNTRTGITKALVASLGNLVVVGIGLISLGRFGARRRA